MFGLPFGDQDIPTLALEGYVERCEAGVAALARACGMNPQREVERFRWAQERLGKQSTATAGQENPMAALTHMIGGALPMITELVVTYAGTGPKGFVYLGQGKPAASLPDALAALLAGTLQVHLEANGSQQDAALLADSFKLAFPDLRGLAQFSPLAQGMIVGVAPAGDSQRLKIYYNTRLDPSGGHRDKVTRMLERSGVGDQGMYDALYAEVEGAHFHGVGVDLDGDGSHRAKLYVRVPYDALIPTLRDVAGKLGEAPDHVDAEVVRPVERMLTALHGDAIADQVELAAALRDDGPPTVKVTVFYSSQHAEPADGDRVCAYLGELGYDSSGLREAIELLSEGCEEASAQKHPLHGVGIEVPVGDRPKVNVYAQPVI